MKVEIMVHKDTDEKTKQYVNNIQKEFPDQVEVRECSPTSEEWNPNSNTNYMSSQPAENWFDNFKDNIFDTLKCLGYLVLSICVIFIVVSSYINCIRITQLEASSQILKRKLKTDTDDIKNDIIYLETYVGSSRVSVNWDGDPTTSIDSRIIRDREILFHLIKQLQKDFKYEIDELKKDDRYLREKVFRLENQNQPDNQQTLHPLNQAIPVHQLKLNQTPVYPNQHYLSNAYVYPNNSRKVNVIGP